MIRNSKKKNEYEHSKKKKDMLTLLVARNVLAQVKNIVIEIQYLFLPLICVKSRKLFYYLGNEIRSKSQQL